MTRSECEKIIGGCLKTIRAALEAYLPDYPMDEVICSMYVSGRHDSAWVLKPEGEHNLANAGSNDYLLNYTECYSGEDDEE